MTKEQLTALGLTEEQATQAIAAFNTGLEDYVAKSDLPAPAEATAMTPEEAEALEQLKQLVKDFDGTTLAEKASGYQKAAETERAKHFDFFLNNALVEAKVRNPSLVRSTLRLEDIRLDENGTLTGLEEQLAPLRKSDPYIFADPLHKPKGSTGAFAYVPPLVENKVNIGERLGKQAAESTGESPYFK